MLKYTSELCKSVDIYVCQARCGVEEPSFFHFVEEEIMLSGVRPISLSQQTAKALFRHHGLTPQAFLGLLNVRIARASSRMTYDECDRICTFGG